ncbi:MAG: inositol monophosphatase family protein, partial [Alphaproteobacteria bacterium]
MAALRPPVINVIDKAVRRAGRGLVRDFGEVQELQVSRKGTADFVTAADLKAEKTLKEDLSKAHPDWTLHMEESGVSGPPDALTRWIVDPLDGTTNFIHGIPHFAISVAVEESGRITAGAVYHPLTDDFYWAAQGIG